MTAAAKCIALNHIAFARKNIETQTTPAYEWRRVAQHALQFNGGDDVCEAADFLVRFAVRQARLLGVRL